MYKCSDTEYKIVLLSDIIFGEKIIDMVDTYGIIIQQELINNFYDDGTFNLNKKRLENIFSGWDIGLPAIIVKKNLVGKYEVINGRHRLCACIILGSNSIPVKLISE